MNIRTTRISQAKPSTSKQKADSVNIETPAQDGLTVKDVVTKAAFTTGGALGGTGLGVVTGLALSNVSGSPLFGQVGGAVGAIGGAVAGISMSSDKVSKEDLSRSIGSWAGASIGSSAGMYVASKFGNFIAQNGASALFASSGALLGTTAGGLVGASIPFIGAEGKGAEVLKNVGTTVGGAGVGLFAGGGVQAMISNMVASAWASNSSEEVAAALSQLPNTFPELGIMLAPVPILAGAAAGLSALDRKQNEGAYRPEHKGLRAARNTSLAALAGYAGGAAVGGIITGVTGHANYLVSTPIVGAAVAGLAALGGHESGQNENHDNAYFKLAKTTGLTALGAGVGDAIGHGLSAVTGNSVYKTIGLASGAVNGLAAGLRSSGIDDKKGLPLVTGVLTGGASGALLGAGISALSGQQIWNVVTPILGAATGGLTGLALALQKDAAEPPKS